MLQKTNTRTANLVQCRDDPSLAVFQPMTGDGTFGTKRWTTWKFSKGILCAEKIAKTPLTYQEQCRLCDLHETHFFWWVKVINGAFMFAQAYSDGVVGQALPHPERKTDSDGGGSRV